MFLSYQLSPCLRVSTMESAIDDVGSRFEVEARTSEIVMQVFETINVPNTYRVSLKGFTSTLTISST